MKTALFCLLIGALLGVIGWRYYRRAQNPTLGERATAVADQAEDWRLTPENIKGELRKTGRVVRGKAKAVGERLDDARIIAVIKGKYVVEKDLSTFAIAVDCRDGVVKLTGSVTAVENIARAVTLALQTGGVHSVDSQLVVRN